MFDGKYFEWNQKRIKAIIDYYGYQFFYGKKVADLGCGYADISGALYRLGSDVSAIDAREEHLKIVTKKYSGIKTVKANLDGPWPFYGQKFDLILDLGLACHLHSLSLHLKAVCASTNYLILEMAVCDSDDPDKIVQVPEDKGAYDLSYNGMGCRPSAAYVERLLKSYGMDFKRMDNAKFNSGDYIYDWQSRNDGTTNINKRRIWFATRNNSAVDFTDVIAPPPPAVIQNPNPIKSFAETIQSSGVPVVLTASPKPPMGPDGPVEKTINIPPVPPPVPNTPATLPAHYSDLSPSSIGSQVKKNSREFALVSPDDFAPPITFPTGGVIWPNSVGSRRWFKKIFPLFPSLRVSSRAFTMSGFPKVSDAPNLIMCSLETLVPEARIWIEEWAPGSLTDERINILRSSPAIFTPSLINAQEILKVIPSANVQRIERPWPMLNIDPFMQDYFLYFEKDQELTARLFSAWNDRFGKLMVVGTSLKTPGFASFFADTTGYKDLSKLFMGAKGVIDLSDNNYYMSGIIKLTQAYSLPIITNNTAVFNQNNSFIIEQDKTVATIPTASNIQKAIDNFISSNSNSRAKFDDNYNNSVNDDVRKLMGV